MRHFLLVLPLLICCGSDPCLGLDPDIRAFWTDEQRELCPGHDRPHELRRLIAAAVPAPTTEPSPSPSPPSCEDAQNLTASTLKQDSTCPDNGSFNWSAHQIVFSAQQ